METEYLTQYWQDKGEVIVTKKVHAQDRKKLSAETLSFLSTCGLPASTPPFLDFELMKEAKLLTPNELFRIYYQDLEAYLTIGSNGSGDPVCIDLLNQEQICYLNHDNDFESTFINTTIKKFACSLIIYHEFFTSLLAAADDDYSHRKFSDEEYTIVKNKFLAIDSNCLDENSFWHGNLTALKWERDHE